LFDADGVGVEKKEGRSGLARGQLPARTKGHAGFKRSGDVLRGMHVALAHAGHFQEIGGLVAHKHGRSSRCDLLPQIRRQRLQRRTAGPSSKREPRGCKDLSGVAIDRTQAKFSNDFPRAREVKIVKARECCALAGL